MKLTSSILFFPFLLATIAAQTFVLNDDDLKAIRAGRRNLFPAAEKEDVEIREGPEPVAGSNEVSVTTFKPTLPPSLRRRIAEVASESEAVSDVPTETDTAPELALPSPDLSSSRRLRGRRPTTEPPTADSDSDTETPAPSRGRRLPQTQRRIPSSFRRPRPTVRVQVTKSESVSEADPEETNEISDATTTAATTRRRGGFRPRNREDSVRRRLISRRPLRTRPTAAKTEDNEEDNAIDDTPTRGRPTVRRPTSSRSRFRPSSPRSNRPTITRSRVRGLSTTTTTTTTEAPEIEELDLPNTPPPRIRTPLDEAPTADLSAASPLEDITTFRPFAAPSFASIGIPASPSTEDDLSIPSSSVRPFPSSTPRPFPSSTARPFPSSTARPFPSSTTRRFPSSTREDSRPILSSTPRIRPFLSSTVRPRPQPTEDLEEEDGGISLLGLNRPNPFSRRPPPSAAPTPSRTPSRQPSRAPQPEEDEEDFINTPPTPVRRPAFQDSLDSPSGPQFFEEPEDLAFNEVPEDLDAPEPTFPSRPRGGGRPFSPSPPAEEAEQPIPIEEFNRNLQRPQRPRIRIGDDGIPLRPNGQRRRLPLTPERIEKLRELRKLRRQRLQARLRAQGQEDFTSPATAEGEFDTAPGRRPQGGRGLTSAEVAEQREREEAERRARVEAEQRARFEDEQRLRAEEERKALIEEERREAARQAKLKEERERAEAERRARIEAERREAARLARIEAERKARIEQERREREEAERLAKIEEERREAARLERLEQERIAKLEAERRARIEAERREREEAERRAKIEAERRAKLEAERRAKLEAERRAKLEEERREAARLARIEQEEREEAERRARLEKERQEKAEAERRARIEAQRRAKIEAERREAARLARIEEEERRIAAIRAKEEKERREAQRQARLKAEREEAERRERITARKRKEEEEERFAQEAAAEEEERRRIQKQRQRFFALQKQRQFRQEQERLRKTESPQENLRKPNQLLEELAIRSEELENERRPQPPRTLTPTREEIERDLREQAKRVTEVVSRGSDRDRGLSLQDAIANQPEAGQRPPFRAPPFRRPPSATENRPTSDNRQSPRPFLDLPSLSSPRPSPSSPTPRPQQETLPRDGRPFTPFRPLPSPTPSRPTPRPTFDEQDEFSASVRPKGEPLVRTELIFDPVSEQFNTVIVQNVAQRPGEDEEDGNRLRPISQSFVTPSTPFRSTTTRPRTTESDNQGIPLLGGSPIGVQFGSTPRPPPSPFAGSTPRPQSPFAGSTPRPQSLFAGSTPFSGSTIGPSFASTARPPIPQATPSSDTRSGPSPRPSSFPAQPPQFVNPLQDIPRPPQSQGSRNRFNPSSSTIFGGSGINNFNPIRTETPNGFVSIRFGPPPPPREQQSSSFPGSNSRPTSFSFPSPQPQPSARPSGARNFFSSQPATESPFRQGSSFNDFRPLTPISFGPPSSDNSGTPTSSVSSPQSQGGLPSPIFGGFRPIQSTPQRPRSLEQPSEQVFRFQSPEPGRLFNFNPFRSAPFQASASNQPIRRVPFPQFNSNNRQFAPQPQFNAFRPTRNIF